jgi:hypothetical protein
MNVCAFASYIAVPVAGLVLDLVGTLLLVSPLFTLRPRDVVRGDAAPAWSQVDDKEAKLLRRQLRVAIPGAVLLILGVGLQILVVICALR